jgi:hypothetical protein
MDATMMYRSVDEDVVVPVGADDKAVKADEPPQDSVQNCIS